MSKYLGGWSRRLFQMLFDLISNRFSIPISFRTEANVRNGNQFYISPIFEVPSGESKLFLIRFAEDVVVTDRNIMSNGVDTYYRVYENSTINNDGSPLAVENYNRVTPESTQSDVFEDPDVSANGNMFIESWLPGEAGIGNRTSGSFTPAGVVRVVAAGDYLVEISNESDDPSQVQYFITWSEGEIFDLGDEPTFPT